LEATRVLKVRAIHSGYLSLMPEYVVWQEIVDKRVNDVINAPIALPTEHMGLQYMMISKI
jgi:hypothetical protein